MDVSKLTEAIEHHRNLSVTLPLLFEQCVYASFLQLKVGLHADLQMAGGAPESRAVKAF